MIVNNLYNLETEEFKSPEDLKNKVIIKVIYVLTNNIYISKYTNLFLKHNSQKHKPSEESFCSSILLKMLTF